VTVSSVPQNVGVLAVFGQRRPVHYYWLALALAREISSLLVRHLLVPDVLETISSLPPPRLGVLVLVPLLFHRRLEVLLLVPLPGVSLSRLELWLFPGWSKVPWQQVSLVPWVVVVILWECVREMEEE
jgi:hypothetical protein